MKRKIVQVAQFEGTVLAVSDDGLLWLESSSQNGSIWNPYPALPDAPDAAPVPAAAGYKLRSVEFRRAIAALAELLEDSAGHYGGSGIHADLLLRAADALIPYHDIEDKPGDEGLARANPAMRATQAAHAALVGLVPGDPAIEGRIESMRKEQANG